MRNLGKHIVAAAGLAAVVALGSGVATAQDKIKLVFGGTYTDVIPTGVILKKNFNEMILRHSNNRIDIDYVFDNKLCVEHKCVEQARLGLVDMGASSTGNIGAFGKTFDIDFLPYMWKSEEANDKALLGWYGQYLRDEAAKEMKLYVFAQMESMGYRNLQNKVREVKVPADLKGIKIRTTKSPVEFALMKAWGAVAVPYDWGQLYEGLSAGVVEGMFIPTGWVGGMRFDDVTKFNTQVEGSLVTLVQFMDLKRYQGLPQWAQEAIEKSGRELQRTHLAIDLEMRKPNEKRVYDNAKVYKPTEAEMKLWRAGAPEAWKAMEGRYDKKVARRVLEEQGGMEDFIQLLAKDGMI